MKAALGATGKAKAPMRFQRSEDYRSETHEIINIRELSKENRYVDCREIRNSVS
jgi:hypothetical protein